MTDLLMQRKIYLKKAKVDVDSTDRIKKKNSKRNITLEVKTSSFYWNH
jgi:hypothetical protein